jgi:hypothetical protein
MIGLPLFMLSTAIACAGAALVKGQIPPQIADKIETPHDVPAMLCFLTSAVLDVGENIDGVPERTVEDAICIP